MGFVFVLVLWILEVGLFLVVCSYDGDWFSLRQFVCQNKLVYIFWWRVSYSLLLDIWCEVYLCSCMEIIDEGFLDRWNGVEIVFFRIDVSRFIEVRWFVKVR